ncbi:MAG: acyltransferase family protein [Phycisphaeraceae bacterium]
MPDTAPAATSRLIGLDLLRALAIALVLFSHAPVPVEGDLPGLASALLLGLKRGGWVGVDLFFVLSGFLVSGLLLRERRRHGSVRVGRFLVRRGWKIYPPLIVFVVFVVLHNRVTMGYWPVDRFVATALFIQSYVPGMQTHLWSIAVEEHAYLLIAGAFGACAWLSHRRQRGMTLAWMPWAIGGAMVLVLALRVHHAGAGDFSHETHLFPTHLRIDGILAGVLLAYFYHEQPTRTAAVLRRGRWSMLVGGAGLLLPPFLWTAEQTPWIYTYGLTTNTLACLLLLGGTLAFDPARTPLRRTLAGVGRHSYSIYLWHVIAYDLLLCAITGGLVAKPAWDGPFALRLSLFMAVAVVVGVGLSVLIEVPVLRLRDRVSPSRSGAVRPVDHAEPPATPAPTKTIAAARAA